MDRFGFDFPVPVYADQVEKLRSSQAEADTRLYGITNPDDARTAGYQLASLSGEDKRPAELPDQSEAYTLVLTGGQLPGGRPGEEPTSPGEVDGVPIPPGGCLGEAWKSIAGTPNGLGAHPQPGRSLLILANSAAQSDPRWRAVVDEWVSCMGESGYHVTDIFEDEGDIGEAQQRAYGTPVPAAEVALALADIACKKDVDLVRRLNQVVQEYASQSVEDHQLELNEERDRLDALLKKAASVIGKEAEDIS